MLFLMRRKITRPTNRPTDMRRNTRKHCGRMFWDHRLKPSAITIQMWVQSDPSLLCGQETFIKSGPPTLPAKQIQIDQIVLNLVTHYGFKAAGARRNNSKMVLMGGFFSRPTFALRFLKNGLFDLREKKNSCRFEAAKTLNFAPKRPLRPQRKKTARFEAEKTLKNGLFDLREKTAAGSRLKNAQLRSKQVRLKKRSTSLQNALRPQRKKKTAAGSRQKNAQLRSKAASSSLREITAACSKPKFVQLRFKTASLFQREKKQLQVRGRKTLNFALKRPF